MVFINKINFKKYRKKILDIVENLVTPKRTLIIPSFSSDAFLRENKFDLKLSLDNKNGIISKEALKRDYYYRTPQPLHSYLVTEKKLKKLKI